MDTAHMTMHTTMRRLPLAALAAALALVGAACATVPVEDDAGQPYTLQVVNEMPHPMILSVDDGETTRILGTVGADRQEYFVIHHAGGGTVTVIATDQEETHTVRRTVVLDPNDPVEVRIN